MTDRSAWPRCHVKTYLELSKILEKPAGIAFDAALAFHLFGWSLGRTVLNLIDFTHINGAKVQPSSWYCKDDGEWKFAQASEWSPSTDIMSTEDVLNNVPDQFVATRYRNWTARFGKCRISNQKTFELAVCKAALLWTFSERYGKIKITESDFYNTSAPVVDGRFRKVFV